jgi:hypothetical protein
MTVPRSRTEIGRLAMRVEGNSWNAYWAPSQTTMEGAVFLGSIHMAAAQHAEFRQAFLALMQRAFGTLVEEWTGSPAEWDIPRPRSEHERSGEA